MLRSIDPMIILGIDPGSQRTGWGCIEQEGSTLLLRGVGVIRAPAKGTIAEKAAVLVEGLEVILQEQNPDMVAMEAVFGGPNTKSLIVLAEARGALLSVVGRAGLPLLSLTPAEVKKAVTGRGGATKEQIAHMVGVLLGPRARGEEVAALGLDATDALGVAIAAMHRGSGQIPTSSVG